MKLLNSFLRQFNNALTLVGAMVSAVYVMRYLGFNNPLPWQYEYYPVCFIGMIIGLMIREYLDSSN
ncbi:MAG: hypothetical protein P4L31_06330 [Candidatus Babeliales bacterium]|nr:hypothetical protein [Candidatus Babeliales bacterium]